MRSLALLLLTSAAAFSQTSELAFSIGAFTPRSNGVVELSDGVALQANYAHRLWGPLYGEINFIANPQRLVTSADPRATRDIATLFLTPGLRLQFASKARVSPFVVIGGGYAAFEQSKTRLDGAPNQASRELSRGVLDYGGGLDIRAFRPWLAFRAEARDYYTGAPGYNIASIRGGQHNVAATIGFVLRFGND